MSNKSKFIRPNFWNRFFDSDKRNFALSLLACGLLSTQSQALPQGEQVLAGSVSFNRNIPDTLNVNSASQTAIVNYQSFNVGSAETVNFNLPSAQSAILNRVVGANPSEILGRINSNGQVFLINNNGIVFGQNAQINVGSLTASTLNITDSDFLSGNYRFIQDGKAAGIINFGSLSAQENMNLIAGSIRNSGNLSGQRVNLLVGKQVAFNLDRNISANVTIDQPLEERVIDFQQAIYNDGNITTPSEGTIALQSSMLGSVYDLAVNNTGIIQARGMGDILVSGQGGAVINNGSLIASNNDGQGGNVSIFGDRVALLDDSLVDASGRAGGGNIRVGGNYQGKVEAGSPDAFNSVATLVTSSSTLKADALSEGDGGKIILWSDGWTDFRGSLSAQGGTEGGDGGFAEVSGSRSLYARGQYELSSPKGNVGTLLFDPLDIEIRGGSADGSDTNENQAGLLFNNNSPLSLVNQILFNDVGDADPFIIYESEIERMTPANLILQAANSIKATGSFTDNSISLVGGLGTGGQSLTFETRNDPGDGVDGIDLTGTTHGAGFFLKTNGAPVTLRTGAGSNGQAAPIKIAGIEAINGDITLQTNGGNISASGLLSGRDLTVTTTSGNFSKDGSTSFIGNEISTAFNSLTANTNSGVFVLSDQDNIDLLDSNIASGSLFLKSAGDLRVIGDINLTSGRLQLDTNGSSSDILVSESIISSANGNISLSSGRDVKIEGSKDITISSTAGLGGVLINSKGNVVIGEDLQDYNILVSGDVQFFNISGDLTIIGPSVDVVNGFTKLYAKEEQDFDVNGSVLLRLGTGKTATNPLAIVSTSGQQGINTIKGVTLQGSDTSFTGGSTVRIEVIDSGVFQSISAFSGKVQVLGGSGNGAKAQIDNLSTVNFGQNISGRLGVTIESGSGTSSIASINNASANDGPTIISTNSGDINILGNSSTSSSITTGGADLTIQSKSGNILSSLSDIQAGKTGTLNIFTSNLGSSRQIFGSVSGGDLNIKVGQGKSSFDSNQNKFDNFSAQSSAGIKAEVSYTDFDTLNVLASNLDGGALQIVAGDGAVGDLNINGDITTGIELFLGNDTTGKIIQNAGVIKTNLLFTISGPGEVNLTNPDNEISSLFTALGFLAEDYKIATKNDLKISFITGGSFGNTGKVFSIKSAGSIDGGTNNLTTSGASIEFLADSDANGLGALTNVGLLNSKNGDISLSGAGISLAKNVIAGTGDVSINLTGTGNGTQVAGTSITGNTLDVSIDSGNLVFDSALNDFDSIQISSKNGSASYSDLDDIFISFANMDNDKIGKVGSLTLNTFNILGGSIGQGNDPKFTIIADNLTISTISGQVNLDNRDNDINNLTATTSSGFFQFFESDGLTINSIKAPNAFVQILSDRSDNNNNRSGSALPTETGLNIVGPIVADFALLVSSRQNVILNDSSITSTNGIGIGSQGNITGLSVDKFPKLTAPNIQLFTGTGLIGSPDAPIGLNTSLNPSSFINDPNGLGVFTYNDILGLRLDPSNLFYLYPLFPLPPTLSQNLITQAGANLLSILTSVNPQKTDKTSCQELGDGIVVCTTDEIERSVAGENFDVQRGNSIVVRN